MDNNIQSNDSLAESKESFLNLKNQNYVKILIFLLVGIVAVFWFIYKSSNFDIITIVSKDGTQKISLMKNNTKYRYRWVNPCPKGYHIPTAYERRKLGKLWCENEEMCDVNYIGFDNNDIVGTTFYWSERSGSGNSSKFFRGERSGSGSLSKFFNDFNIYLDRIGNFYAGFYNKQKLGIKNNNSYCNALTFGDSRGLAVAKVYYYDLYDCEKPKYVRCFSDENLTPEFINEEDFSSKFSIEYTKFEIDGTYYSGRKITSMPRGDVIIPNSFVGIPIIEVGGGLYGNITSVKLGENIIKIDSHAFSSNKIKEIEIPDSVLYIGDYAFNNNQLTSVKFSDNLLYIGENAFDNSVKLPDTVKFIGTGAFSNNKISLTDLYSQER